VSAEKVGHAAKCACGEIWVIATAGATGVAPSSAVPARPVPTAAVAAPDNGAAAKPEATATPVKDDPAATPTAAAATPTPKTPRRAGAEQTVKRSREEEEARKLIGRELGNFRIEDLLGIGGFGAVYRAFDRSLHRDVAIKVLPESMARAGKEKVQRFLQEARAAAKLSHPNIVTVHQICQVEGIYFIVMELVEGKTLAELVRARAIAPREATRIITEAVRGLAHAHKRGLIHRDIKPGNIMVTGDGQVKMTDFGLARDIFRDSDDTDMGRAVGTPLYMAPEQCEGDEGDSRSDVYALAATYYVALTRRPPYDGRTTQEVMDRQRFDPPPDPRKVVPSLPPAVFRIIEKAMSKDPDGRYQTAAELLNALEGLDFATLDPNATLTLDAVSAQISGVTPEVGSHVGAVMQSAIRRAEHSRSLSATRAMGGASTSPMRWWILAGVLVALLAIGAIGLAMIIARQGGEDNGPLPQYGTPATSAPVPAPAKPSDTASGTQPKPSAQETETSSKSPPETVTPDTPPEPESASLTGKEQVAMKFYEDRVRYEREHPENSLDEKISWYQYILDHHANTKAAVLAQKAIDRLMATEKTPSAPQTEPSSEEKPAETEPAPPAN
jgi:serine/threonine-protein kinase